MPLHMNKLAVVALGGNALQRDNQKGTIEEQEKNTFNTIITSPNLKVKFLG